MLFFILPVNSAENSDRHKFFLLNFLGRVISLLDVETMMELKQTLLGKQNVRLRATMLQVKRC